MDDEVGPAQDGDLDGYLSGTAFCFALSPLEVDLSGARSSGSLHFCFYFQFGWSAL